MTRDWQIALACFLLALFLAGYGVIASVQMTEAFTHSEPVTFSRECLDNGGRAGYNDSERLVCVVDGQTVDILEGVR